MDLTERRPLNVERAESRRQQVKPSNPKTMVQLVVPRDQYNKTIFAVIELP